MAVSIVMPQLGNEIEEASVDGWLKNIGDKIEKGEQIVTITTPKVTMEIEAPASGTLTEIIIPADELASVGAVLGTIEEALKAMAGSNAAMETDATALPCPVRPQGGEGPDLFLIHGFGSDRLSWTANIPSLTASSKVFAVDLPGHGSAGADVGDGTIETLADAFEAALDHLGAERVTLVGHSLGGGVALLIAARRLGRVDALVLIAPAGLGQGVDPGFLHAYPLVREAVETEALLQRLVSRPRLINKQLVAMVQKQLTTPGIPEALTKVALGIERAGDSLRTAIDTVAQSGVPRLVIWGEADRINPPDAKALAAFGGDAFMIADVSHLPQIEAASAVNGKIDAFLRERRR